MRFISRQLLIAAAVLVASIAVGAPLFYRTRDPVVLWWIVRAGLLVSLVIVAHAIVVARGRRDSA